jgi:hypothetical protein
MPQYFEESNLKFSFDDRWKAIKYDTHLNHTNIKIQHHKAVDFLAIFDDKKTFLFEMKSFKNHRIEAKNAGRTTNNSEELIIEISQKVRDSIAGIFGAGRNPNSYNHDEWKTISNRIANPKSELYIVAWIEEDKPVGYYQKKAKVKSTTTMDKLKAKLRWLNAKVLICNIDDEVNFEGLTVVRLPNV